MFTESPVVVPQPFAYRSLTRPPGYVVETQSDGSFTVGDGEPSFVVRVPTKAYWQQLVRFDAYRAGVEFIRGSFDVEGDLPAAIETWVGLGRAATLPYLLRSLLPRLRVERWIQSRRTARRNIEFHYDRSNDFYRLFLDARLVYSCAYFDTPDATIDDAQAAKLDHICRKLDLRPGDAFLDIGCGWGALVARAAERYGVEATGCTLSMAQYKGATELLADRRLDSRAHIEPRDYRDLTGRFDKIASVGMIEHVGRARLGEYFRTVAARLDDSGLFLNHGIVRPAGVREDAATYFLQRRVFPGSELPHLSHMLDMAAAAGFEVLDVENLRPHYALTCRAWVARLQANRAACLATVDEATYRTWLLYLAGSAINFTRGLSDVYQVLLAKRSPAQVRYLTRRYQYRE
jgi:cyclopropane-fatty-acyl-phospholipid synthase